MNKRLFVAGLPFSTSSEELKALFMPFGNVISSDVITDRASGRSKGFGFVEMETEDEAKEAMAKLHDTEFGGRKLIVNEAKPRDERPRENRSRFGQRQGGFRGGFGGQKKSFVGRKRSFNRGGFRSGRS